MTSDDCFILSNTFAPVSNSHFDRKKVVLNKSTWLSDSDAHTRAIRYKTEITFTVSNRGKIVWIANASEGNPVRDLSIYPAVYIAEISPISQQCWRGNDAHLVLLSRHSLGFWITCPQWRGRKIICLWTSDTPSGDRECAAQIAEVNLPFFHFCAFLSTEIAEVHRW